MLRRTLSRLSFVSKMERVNQGVALSPREGLDFEMQSPDQVIPGAHPLPLRKRVMEGLMFEPISPYMPSPQRVHPYFQEPLPELPHLPCSVPIVYLYNTIKVPIIFPVFNLSGEVTHTREVDPFVFGQYPHSQLLYWGYDYWDRRCQDFIVQNDYEISEVYKPDKKEWPNAGSGRKRAGNRKTSRYAWGARNKSTKPWRRFMPTQKPDMWRRANSMALTTKMLQGKLQVVEKLTLQEPTKDAFMELCSRMGWDTRHTGGGVLFIDGGSRIAPTKDYDRNFFYGSFINGKVKVMRPTVDCEEAINWNRSRARLSYLGPKGPQNPVPINHFNVYDALTHDRVVITEGAIEQIETEMMIPKYRELPAHIRNQLPMEGGFDKRGVLTIQEEVAGRIEESEVGMYQGYYDNPYEPWADEDRASYSVSEVDGVVRRSVDGKPGSWKMLK
eukprot:PhM_4_TR5682/c0_g1_i1/m.73921/K02926/RP-L4, MRPL4, rplD; large subunit ribosomal protein L4